MVASNLAIKSTIAPLLTIFIIRLKIGNVKCSHFVLQFRYIALLISTEINLVL